MIVLATIVTLGAMLWTGIVFKTNALSDASQSGFRFGGTLMVAWLIIAIWAAWWVG